MVDELELLRSIRQAEQEIEEGKGIPHSEAVEMLRSRLAERLGD